MSRRPGAALRLALRDFYANSWRLVPLNFALGAVLIAVGAAAVNSKPAIVLFALGGPFVAAIAHASVTVVREGRLVLRDVRDGFVLHWRRGFVLGLGGSVVFLLGVVAVGFYRDSHLMWPLAALTIYVVVLLGIYQLLLWTLAIAEPSRPLRAVARDAFELVARRPSATLLLGLALLFVNAVGIAAAVMPFLTLTIAYSFLAAAHFALPPTVEDPV
jgi:hypothetical protein